MNTEAELTKLQDMIDEIATERDNYIEEIDRLQEKIAQLESGEGASICDCCAVNKATICKQCKSLLTEEEQLKNLRELIKLKEDYDKLDKSNYLLTDQLHKANSELSDLRAQKSETTRNSAALQREIIGLGNVQMKIDHLEASLRSKDEEIEKFKIVQSLHNQNQAKGQSQGQGTPSRTGSENFSFQSPSVSIGTDISKSQGGGLGQSQGQEWGQNQSKGQGQGTPSRTGSENFSFQSPSVSIGADISLDSPVSSVGTNSRLNTPNSMTANTTVPNPVHLLQDLYVIKVIILSAENLNYSTANTAAVMASSENSVIPVRPYVVVNTLQSTSASASNATDAKCISSSISKSVQESTRYPVWGQELTLGVNGLSQLVFTVYCGETNFLGQSEVLFLGQAVVDCAELPNKSDETRELSLSLPLFMMTRPCYRTGLSVDGGELLSKHEIPAKESLGTLHVKISVPTPSENVCGYLFKISRSIFGTTSGVKKWVKLYDGKIHIYDGPWGSESVLHEIVDCDTILKVTIEAYTRTEIPMDGFRITYTTSRKRDIFVWTVDSPHIAAMWMYAFNNCRGRGI